MEEKVKELCFRVRYFVMCDHVRFGHTRESGHYDCRAANADEALQLAQEFCNGRFKRVKQADFKPTEKHSYPHKDEFDVSEVGWN